MEYTIQFTPIAESELNALPRKIKDQVFSKIVALAENPRPHGCKKLEGLDDLYRIRSGDYRVVYQIVDQILVVMVVRIGHRGTVYRRLPRPGGENAF